MAPNSLKKVASSPRKPRNGAKGLKPLALEQLAAALNEGGISVSELLRILALPEEDGAANRPLPDGWKLYTEDSEGAAHRTAP